MLCQGTLHSTAPQRPFLAWGPQTQPGTLQSCASAPRSAQHPDSPDSPHHLEQPRIHHVLLTCCIYAGVLIYQYTSGLGWPGPSLKLFQAGFCFKLSLL